MLAHKVDGKNQAGYSDLILDMRKLERKAEARDSLAPKTAMTSASNVTCSQTSGTFSPHASWKVIVLSPLELWPLAAMRLRKTLVQSRERMERQNLQLMKRPKHQVEWEEQINLWSILFILPRWSNYTNRKTGVVLGAEVPTTSCGVAQKTLAKQHEKWI